MSLTQKEKVQLRRQSKRKVTPTGLFLYHPASDRWIPAQADEEGRLVIDPSDLDTRYLKLDGSKKMLGDLKLADNVQLLFSDLSGGQIHVKFDEPNWRLKFYDDDSWLIDLECYEMYCQQGIDVDAIYEYSSGHGIEFADTPKFDFFDELTPNHGIDVVAGKRLDACAGIFRFPCNRPASPLTGDVRYDAPTDTFEIFDGTVWRSH